MSSAETSSQTEHVRCNLCGSNDQRFAYTKPDEVHHPNDWFSVVECKRCGLGFVNPRPTLEQMGRYYPEAFYESFETAHNVHLTRYRREAAYLQRYVSTGSGRVLDIGCASGGFPRYMRALGWNAEGLEISNHSRPIADFPVFTVPFPDIPIDEPTYDAVTAWAVLEHVHDPMAHFAKASKILKTGGVFIFLVTNFNSIGSRSLFVEDVPRHLYFFTEACVKEYLSKTGFELVRADYDDKIFALSSNRWLAYYMSRLRGRPFTWEDARFTRERFFRERNLKPTAFNTARYAARVPLFVLGRLLLPIHSRAEMLTRRYGIVTYVARRSKHGGLSTP